MRWAVVSVCIVVAGCGSATPATTNNALRFADLSEGEYQSLQWIKVADLKIEKLRDDLGIRAGQWPAEADGQRICDEIKDGWGRKLKYTTTGTRFNIHSAGLDGEMRTADDITAMDLDAFEKWQIVERNASLNDPKTGAQWGSAPSLPPANGRRLKFIENSGKSQWIHSSGMVKVKPGWKIRWAIGRLDPGQIVTLGVHVRHPDDKTDFDNPTFEIHGPGTGEKSLPISGDVLVNVYTHIPFYIELVQPTEPQPITVLE